MKDLLSTGGDLDKVTRARSAAVRMESVSIYFRKDAHWLPESKDELVAFDKSTHDDQMDVTSYAARCLVETFVMMNRSRLLLGSNKLNPMMPYSNRKARV